MNPARLHALFDAYFAPKRRAPAQAGATEPQGERSLAAFNGVYHVGLELFKVGIGNIAGNDINSGISYTAALTLTKYLDTLLTAVCTLVELSREVFNCKYVLVITELRKLIVYNVNSRL